MSKYMIDNGIDICGIFTHHSNPSWYHWHRFIDDPRFCLLKKTRAYNKCRIIDKCHQGLQRMVTYELNLHPGKHMRRASLLKARRISRRKAHCTSLHDFPEIIDQTFY